MASPQKTVIRAPQWLGDAVVSTFFLAQLKKKLGDTSLVVAAPPYLKDLYAAHPDVSEFVPVSFSVRETAARIRAVNAQSIYILPRSFRTALEAWFSAIPERVGFPGDFRRPLLTRVVRYEPNVSYPQRYLKLIGEEGMSLRGQTPFFPKADLDLAGAAAQFGFSPEEWRTPVLGLGPASIAPSRTWPWERFVEVAQQHRAETNGTVVLFGSEREAPVTRAIRDAVGKGAIDTAGKLNLPQLGWFVSQCQQFVCNDSGLMHVASAFNVPTVVIFGASDPKYALPQSDHFSAIQRTDLDCVPCLRNYCVRLGDMNLACLRGVSADEVKRALAKH